MRLAAAQPPKLDDDLLAELRAFSFNGAATIVEERRGVPFFFNEFWTARQRQGHRIHEISYRACFKPQLPEFFISRLTRKDDGVYDPFMGRGTTLIQAAIQDRRPLGNDVNPLSALLVRPRLSPPKLADVAKRLEEIDWNFDGAFNPELLVFYHPDTLRQICALRTWLAARAQSGAFDASDDWVRMVALNRLTGHSAGFFSVYTLPPNQAVSIEAQRKINAKRGQIPPRRDVPAIILKKSRTLLGGAPFGRSDAILSTAPSSATPAIPSASAQLVVTSPPFLDVVQYAQDNWLRCWFAGIPPAEVNISMHKKPDDWRAFVHATFREFARVVASRGYVAFEVGEVRGGAIELEDLVIDALEGTPFAPLCVLVNVQEFTKTANCWGVSNNAKGTNTNRVVLARRA